MIKTVVRILIPYLQAMDPAWTLASFACAALVWAVMKKKGIRHPAAIGFTVLWLGCVAYGAVRRAKRNISE